MIFVLINTINEYMKEKTFLKLNLMIGWDMTIRLFMHMIRLPMKWFDSRVLADILTRFDSLEPIKSLLTNGAITTILNGIFLVFIYLFLNWLSPNLSYIVLAGAVIPACIKVLSLPRTLELSAESLLSGIREKTRKIETIKGIQSIKTMSGEIKMESKWLNSFSDLISTMEKNNSFGIIINTLIKTFENVFLVFIVYFGVTGILDGVLSVGTLFAFISYRMIFLGRFNAVIDILIQIKLLSLHTRRLADLVLEKTDLENIPESRTDLSGTIEVKNLFFTYSGYDEAVIHNLNLKVNSGDFIAISGPSGCGKTTFLKILLGLYQPNNSKILFDGVPAKSIGFHNLRNDIGCVLQNDQLFKGSIAENISFFSEEYNPKRLYDCLKIVEFDQDVKKLPMGLNTEVGEYFSAGQKQRLLMARALYKKPKILVLDESTSNLNMDLEQKVIKNIKELNLTVIAVSHRTSIIELSDRKFYFTNKCLKEI